MIREERIGTLHAHALDDHADRLWPHSIVRFCMEEWSFDSIEHGPLIEPINMKGAIKRLPKDGGQ